MWRRPDFLPCAVLVAALLLPTTDCTAAPSLGARLDAAIQPLVRQGAFSGVVVVTRHGKIVLSKGYGWADRVQHRPNTPNTPYPFFSISKAFTAFAILQLQAQGTVRLSDPACRYLPSCPASWHRITIQDLLRHTAGLPYGYDTDPLDTTGGPHALTAARLVAHWQTFPLVLPGTFSYSNADYNVLADIIQRVSGQAYMTYVRDHLLWPLGVRGIGDAQAYGTLPGRARGYLSGTPAPAFTAFDAAAMIGAASLEGSAADLARWDNALLTAHDMTRTLTRQMWTPQVPIAPQALVSYGDGWDITHLRKTQHAAQGRRVVYHAGVWQSKGFDNLNVLYPDDQVVLVVLGNQDQWADTIWKVLDPILFPQ